MLSRHLETFLFCIMAAKTTNQRGNAGMNLVAPPAGLPFPDHANLTAAELLAFFPNSLKCADVVYRFVSNYGSRKAIYTMINTFRDFEVEWSANCCGSMMYKTMKGAGFQGWNLKKHNDWHDENKANWDENKLDMGGFQTPNTLAQGVPFRSLAVGLRNFPEGDDALDLTRMVRYCSKQPADVWIYPDDYEKLLNLLGGAKRPTKANTDSAVFGRWEDRNPPLPTIKSVPIDIEERAPEERMGKTTDVASRETAATQSSSEAALGPSTPALAGPSKQPKPERHKKQTRSKPVARLEDSDTDPEEWWCSQPYTRQPVSHVYRLRRLTRGVLHRSPGRACNSISS
jgi:hypothetical protein